MVVVTFFYIWKILSNLLICFQSSDKLNEAVLSVDLTTDLRTVVDQKGTGPNQPEQILIESYVSIVTKEKLVSLFKFY